MKRFAFSIAEALITLMIVSLILAAVIPVMSRRQMTTDSMWRYVSSGVGSNSNIFYGLGTAQTAVIGSDSVPVSSSGSRLILVTPIKPAIGNNDTIKRSIIDFQQKTATGVAHIGKISFDDTNIAIGKNTLIANTTGAGNTAVGGGDVLGINTTGWNLTAIGSEALKQNTGGWANTAVGARALNSNGMGDCNTALGEDALAGNTTGIWNIAIGVNALMGNLSGGHNVAIGVNTLNNTGNGSGNIAVGSSALNANTDGHDNVAIGSSSMAANKVGIWNTAVGAGSLQQNTDGISNVAIGTNSMVENKTGGNNTSVGFQSMWKNSNGTQNVAMGVNALFANVSGSFNTIIGSNAFPAGVGSSNVALGQAALFNYSGSGDSNTAIGTRACEGIVNGGGNICLGAWAGPTSSQNNKLYIDTTQTNAPLIGGDFINRTATINGTFYVTGNSYTNGATLVTSDKRLKNIKGDFTSGLDKLLKIHPVRYAYKDDKTKQERVGVIAQELQKTFPKSVIKGPNGYLAIDTSEIIFAAVNSIKDIYKQLQSLIAKISGLDAKITKIEKENLLLKNQIVQMNKQNAIINQRLNKLEHKK